jgi:dienelactone hydrolase
MHVPVYPACATQYLRRKTTGAPILMLIGGADDYAGVTPCTDYAEKLRRDGAKIEVKVYPDALHGFDAERPYSNPKGENWSRCIFEEQADGSFKERFSGLVTNDAKGRSIEANRQKALSLSRTYGIRGGPNAAAKTAFLEDLKAAVRRHLLGQN